MRKFLETICVLAAAIIIPWLVASSALVSDADAQATIADRHRYRALESYARALEAHARALESHARALREQSRSCR